MNKYITSMINRGDKMTLNEMKIIFPEQSYIAPENAIGYIYVTFNINEGLFYIGKASSKKWLDYYYGSGRFPKEWVKNDIELMHWPIQWCFSKEEINQAEFEWIDKFKNHNDICNMHEGGQCNNQFINERARQIRSEENSGKNNPMYGKEKSLETRQKISNTKKEFFKTHQHNSVGCHHSKETKQKISEKAKIRWTEKRGMKNICKPVKCIELNQIFDSMADACRAFGKDKSHINEVCNGKREKTLGYHWEWVK